jgi:ADP-ribose pyrophosphatase
MEARIVSDELVYAGSICRVRKVGLQADDGRVIPRDLIEVANAAVVVPVLGDGGLVLVRNQRFAVGEELLEFPAGKLEAGEDPPACARRELSEETGYLAGRLLPLGGFYTCPGAVTEFIHAFLASDLVPGRPDLRGEERIRVVTVAPERLGEMIRTGELHDAKSIAAWTLWRLREGN